MLEYKHNYYKYSQKMNRLPLSYSTQIISPSQAQTIDMAHKTLLSQADLFNDGLAGIFSPTLLDELQVLMDMWVDAMGGSDELDISILAEASRVSVSVSTNGRVVAGVSEVVRSVYGEKPDASQYVRNDGRFDLPIRVELETEHTIGGLSLLCFQTKEFILTGGRDDVVKIADMLGENGLTAEQFDVNSLFFAKAFYIDPQKIKMDPDYCILLMNGVDIYFRDNSFQMFIMRTMFGKKGRNRVILDLMTLYDFWNEEQGWDTEKVYEKVSGTKIPRDDEDKNTAGIERRTFIKRVRNAVDAINNKVRKAVGMTEDFLEVKNNACRINPEIIQKNSK